MSREYPEIKRHFTSGEAIRSWFRHVEALYTRGLPGQFIPSGVDELDDCIGGWRRGIFSVVAGRPGMGASTLLFQSAVHIALEEDTAVAMVPLNETMQEGVYRVVSAHTGIHRLDIRRGKLSEEEWETLLDAGKHLNEAPLHWLTSPKMFIGDLVDECERLADEEDVEILFVDCLQRLSARGEWQSFEDEITEVTRGLKYIATEVGLTVVTGARLNNDPERRANGRPFIADIYGCHTIGYLADLVLLLYRDELYYPYGDNTGCVELHVAKNVDGATGTVNVYYDDKQLRFI